MQRVAACPRCGLAYRGVPDEMLGQRMTCQECGGRFVLTERPGGETHRRAGLLAGGHAAGGKEESLDGVPIDWQIGDVILGLYKVVSLLGVGGMGKVYRVHHLGWNMDLAVKCPKAEILQVPGAAENFILEAETWVKLGLHPNTCSCYYVRELGRTPRLFAEFVTGGDLEGWIKGDKKKGEAPLLYRDGPEASLARMLDIAIQFAWGLEYAHSQGMIHQDIKPANVMMTKDGVAKVTDFGLARMGSGVGIGGGMVAAAGLSPRWCSPEQAAMHPLNHKTDIWSWGVSILPMFLGSISWRKGTLAPSVLQGFRARGLRGPDGIPPMPEVLADLLEQCFQEDPAARPKDMAEISHRLIDCYQSAVGTPYPRSLPKASKASAESFNNRAISLVDLERISEADDLWNQGLERHPNHPETTFNQSVVHWRSGALADDRLVVERLQESVTSQGGNWFSHYLLGMVHLERGDAQAVVDTLTAIGPQETAWPELQELAVSNRRLRSHSRRLLGSFKGHEGTVTSVRMTPDGRWAVTGAADGTVGIWDLSARTCLKKLTGHTGRVHAVAISADGRVAMSGGEDQTARLWNVKTGKCLRILKGHVQSVDAVALNENGHLALSGGSDNVIKLWDVATGRELRGYTGHAGAVNDIAFDKDGLRFVSGGGSQFSSDYAVRLWDRESGQCLKVMTGHTKPVWAVGFGGDGRLLISGSEDGTVRLWRADSGACVRELLGHKASVNDVGLSADCRFAVSVSGAPFAKDNSLRLWEVATGRCLCTFQAGEMPVLAVALSAGGRFALSGGKDRKLHWWHLNASGYHWNAPLALSRITASEKAFSAAAAFEKYLEEGRRFLEAGDAVAALALLDKARGQNGFARDNRAMELLEMISYRLPRKQLLGGWVAGSWDAWSMGIAAVDFRADGHGVAVGDQEGGVTLWDVALGEEIRRFSAHAGAVSGVEFSADGRKLFTSGEDHLVKVWDLSSGNNIRSLQGHTLKVRCVRQVCNGRFALSAASDETIRLWDVATGQCLRTYKGHTGQVFALSVLPDENRFVSGGEDGLIKIWRLRKGGAVKTLKGHAGQVRTLRVSACGRFLVSGASDGLIIWWDLHTGKSVRYLMGHVGFVRSVDVSADNRFALSAGDDRTVRVWDVETGGVLRVFSGHAKPINGVRFSPSCRYALSAGVDASLKLWALDWEYDCSPHASVWDEAANPFLKDFCTRRLKGGNPLGDGTIPRMMKFFRGSVHGRISPDELRGVMKALGQAGLGWLEPEVVGARLNRMELGIMAKLRGASRRRDGENGLMERLGQGWKRQSKHRVQPDLMNTANNADRGVMSGVGSRVEEMP